MGKSPWLYGNATNEETQMEEREESQEAQEAGVGPSWLQAVRKRRLPLVRTAACLLTRIRELVHTSSHVKCKEKIEGWARNRTLLSGSS